jgi:hypothetical protein
MKQGDKDLDGSGRDLFKTSAQSSLKQNNGQTRSNLHRVQVRDTEKSDSISLSYHDAKLIFKSDSHLYKRGFDDRFVVV